MNVKDDVAATVALVDSGIPEELAASAVVGARMRLGPRAKAVELYQVAAADLIDAFK